MLLPGFGELRIFIVENYHNFLPLNYTEFFTDTPTCLGSYTVFSLAVMRSVASLRLKVMRSVASLRIFSLIYTGPEDIRPEDHRISFYHFRFPLTV